MGNSQSDRFSFFINKDPNGVHIYKIFKSQHPKISLTGEELIVLAAASPHNCHNLPKWALTWAQENHSREIELIVGIIESGLHDDDVVDDVVSILKMMND